MAVSKKKEKAEEKSFQDIKKGSASQLVELSKIDWFSLVGLALVVSFVYLNSLNNTFHYDDYHSLTDNIDIRKLSNIPKYFTHPEMFSARPGVKMPRPLLLITFALNYAWTEYRAWSWMLVNILLHLVNVLIAYLAVLHIGGNKKVALVSALVFAIHPVNSESVNYINCRSTLLCSLFIILSLYLFGLSLLRRRWYFKVGYIISLGLGLLVKEEAFMVPFIALVIDLLFVYPETKGLWRDRIIKYYLPMVAVIIIYMIYRWFVLGYAFGGAPVRPVWQNLLTQTRSFVHYLNILFYPVHLNASYENIDYVYLIKDKVLFNILYLSFLVVLAIVLWRRVKVYSFFIFNFFLTLAPTSSLIPLNAYLNEHRLYLPSLGFSILVASLVEWLAQQEIEGKKLRRFLNFCLVIIFSFYALLLVSRNRVWISDMKLWRDTIQKSPTKAQVISDLGNAYYRSKPPNIERAEQLYKWSIRMDPNYYKAFHNLAIISFTRGKNILDKEKDEEEAREHLLRAVYYFNQALGIFPYLADSWNDMGTTYVYLRDYAKAEECYRMAIRNDPQMFKAYVNLGVALYSQARFEDAVKIFEQAIRVYDKDPKPWMYISNSLANLRKYNEALQVLKECMEALRAPECRQTYDELYRILEERKLLPP